MKKIKMIMSCILTVFLCVILVGCGAKETEDVSNSQYVGTWKAVSVTAMGSESTAQEVFGGDFTLELKADGTYVTNAGTDTTNGTWTETKEGPKLYEEGNKDGAVYKADGDTLVIDMVFAKVVLEKN